MASRSVTPHVLQEVLQGAGAHRARQTRAASRCGERLDRSQQDLHVGRASPCRPAYLGRRQHAIGGFQDMHRDVGSRGGRSQRLRHATRRPRGSTGHPPVTRSRSFLPGRLPRSSTTAVRRLTAVSARPRATSTALRTDARPRGRDISRSLASAHSRAWTSCRRRRSAATMRQESPSVTSNFRRPASACSPLANRNSLRNASFTTARSNPGGTRAAASERLARPIGMLEVYYDCCRTSTTIVVSLMA